MLLVVRMKVFKLCPEAVQKYMLEMKNLEDDYSNFFTGKLALFDNSYFYCSMSNMKHAIEILTFDYMYIVPVI